MKDMKSGDLVRTLVEITVIAGLFKQTIPKGTTGAVESVVASNAGYVKLANYGTLFVMAEDLEWDT